MRNAISFAPLFAILAFASAGCFEDFVVVESAEDAGDAGPPPRPCTATDLDCDGNPTNGCETDTTVDPSNCGACGVVCPGAKNRLGSCKASVCGLGLCMTGFARCDPNAPGDGCETPLDAPPNCGKCNESCVETSANDCTKDSCVVTNGVGACKHYDWGNCAAPSKVGACNLPAACRHDDDGDGLSNEWETNGGIDLNCDGEYDATEKVLTNVDPGNPLGASASPTMKDVFVEYDYMVLPDQLTGGNPTPCTPSGDADFPGRSTDCDFDQYCIAGVCKGHSDGPDPAAVAMVVAAFRAKGINLHIDPVHQKLPHAHVISYGPPVPGCAAPDALTLAMPRRAVDFYAIKNDPAFFDKAHRGPAYHYVVFGHVPACDSDADCSACTPAETWRASGVAEIIGNDAIIAFGGRLDQTGAMSPPTIVNQAATLMHELGHNLGLDHGGPYGLPDAATNNKPNYLSVMNYQHQLSGISRSATPGSTVVADTRVDYQDIAPGGAILRDLGENGALDETMGINSGTNDIAYWYCPARRSGPGTGPINWDCDGAGTLIANASADINRDGSSTTLKSYRDWPSLDFAFQCSKEAHFLDGALLALNEIDWNTAAAQGLLFPILTEAIDVHPERSGVVRVTLWGSATLEVARVTEATLRFGNVGPVALAVADVNGDGRPDLVADFPAAAGPGRALEGRLDTTQAFTASDVSSTIAGDCRGDASALVCGRCMAKLGGSPPGLPPLCSQRPP